MTSIPRTDDKVLPVKGNKNLAAVLELSQKAASAQNERVLKISNQLQTSLNLEELISQFSEEAKSVIPYEHLNFVNEKLDVNFQVGNKGRFSCTYELTINEKKLGILSFTRDQKFTDSEIQELEYLICALHYPLRNAILYHEALNAALKDPLTNVGNRSAMTNTLQQELEKAFRHNRSLGIIMMDIDHFKKINDQYGHAIGDQALKSLVECAEKSVRISDMLFRYGGEEFVIILPETDEPGVLRLAKRIRRRVEKLETRIQNHLIKMTISIGITTLEEADDEKTFVARADAALYKAKRDGRNCIRIAD